MSKGVVVVATGGLVNDLGIKFLVELQEHLKNKGIIKDASIELHDGIDRPLVIKIGNTPPNTNEVFGDLPRYFFDDAKKLEELTKSIELIQLDEMDYKPKHNFKEHQKNYRFINKRKKNRR